MDICGQVGQAKTCMLERALVFDMHLRLDKIRTLCDFVGESIDANISLMIFNFIYPILKCILTFLISPYTSI